MNISYGNHYIDEEDIKSVAKALKSNFITQGNNVFEFEKKLKKKFGAKYCSAVSNGTAALHIGLKSLDIKKGSIVLTSPLTFIATASTIVMNGLIPDFIDINKFTNTIDINLLEDKLKKNKNIKAIIGVDYAGHPCDWSSIAYLKKKYNLWLINDNCHAMGSKIKGSEKYGVKFADIVTQSYHPVKNFTTGEGGSILTNKKKIFDKIQLLRNHGINRSNKILRQKGIWYYTVNDLGYNYRLTDFQSALGISQLKKLNKFVKKRREIAKIYDKSFSKVRNIKIPLVNPNIYHSYHLYPLLIDFKKFTITKKQFFKKMLDKNIKLQVHYVPLYNQKFLKKFKFKKSNYPNTEDFYKQEVSLPIYYSLRVSEQKYIIKNILNLLK